MFIIDAIAVTMGLAMFLLVMWQAPRQRDNQLIALFTATIIYWGLANFIAYLVALTRGVTTPFFYASALGIPFNGYTLFLLATHYAGLWGRTPVRLALLGGMLLIAGIIPFHFDGHFVRLVDNRPMSYFTYEFTSAGYLVFAAIYAYYLGAVAVLWRYRQSRPGKLLAGGVVTALGVLASGLPGLKDLPFGVLAVAFASLFLTRAILKEKMVTPATVQNLRIELDETRQIHQVAEITETQYFQELQAKKNDLRRILENGESIEP